jgi:Na+-transporting methylmalonyl-CoA/oxaloacetate decarboxylase beta subunit
MQEALFTAKRAACINFADDDLLIGTADHKRPLYITGKYGGQMIGRIIVDARSSINIMPLKTLKTITLDVKNLSDEKVIIHDFNQNSQKAL